MGAKSSLAKQQERLSGFPILARRAGVNVIAKRRLGLALLIAGSRFAVRVVALRLRQRLFSQGRRESRNGRLKPAGARTPYSRNMIHLRLDRPSYLALPVMTIE